MKQKKQKSLDNPNSSPNRWPLAGPVIPAPFLAPSSATEWAEMNQLTASPFSLDVLKQLQQMPVVPPSSPLKPKSTTQKRQEFTQFANGQSTQLSIIDQPLTEEQLTKDLQHIAKNFLTDNLFRKHVKFYRLYTKALLHLSLYDLRTKRSPSEIAAINQTVLTQFWQSYFAVNPKAKDSDYFSSVEVSTLLASFLAVVKHSDGIDEASELFYQIIIFLIEQGFLVTVSQETQTVALSNHALTRVLRQLSWFIENFCQVNQKKYTFTPPLSCEIVSQTALPEQKAPDAN